MSHTNSAGQNLFNSTQGNFHAKEIPTHVAGCDGIYWLYKVKTNLQVGKIYGEEGNFMPAYTGESLSVDELMEIASLIEEMTEFYANREVEN